MIAGQTEVGASLGRQVAQLARGRQLVQPAPGFVCRIVRFLLVEPVVGLCQTHRAFTHAQQSHRRSLEAADGVPATFEEEHAGPGLETSGQQGAVVAEEIAPREVRALQQIDFGHHEIVENTFLVRLLLLEGMAAQRALARRHRNLCGAAGALLGWCFAVPLKTIEIDFLLEAAMHQRCRAEIEHDAVGLDHARVFGWINDTQTTTDHLNQRRFVGTGAQQDDAGGRGVVVALGEYGDIDDHGQVTSLKVSERGLAVGLGHVAMHHGRRYTLGKERIANSLGMRHRRAESNGLASHCTLLPMTDDSGIDR